ncbi:MAG: ABC transporter permease [Fimbriiglobus sp.]
MLIALQVGLLIGLFELTSIPVDRTSADLWIGATDVESVDLGRPIPVSYVGRLNKPGMQMPEAFYMNFANFTRMSGSSNMCMVVGSGMTREHVGCADVLTDEHRQLLTENMTIVVDVSDLGKLGMKEIGDRGKVNDKEVRLVGTVSGLKSLAAPWIFCSQSTARQLLSAQNPKYTDHVTYLLAKCESESRATAIAKELQAEYPEMSVYTASEFSTKSRMYWLLRTKAGVALGYAALLGLMVGAVITAQTLYTATMASAKEFATLLALGIPRRKIYGMVMAQSFWVGVMGVSLSIPLVFLLAFLAERAGGRVVLRWEILVGAAVVTMITSLLSGFSALRSVRKIEPMSLLR